MSTACSKRTTFAILNDYRDVVNMTRADSQEYLSQNQLSTEFPMAWLRFVGSLKLYVSFAKEPYKRDDLLQKRPTILRSLLIVATPYIERPKIFYTERLATRFPIEKDSTFENVYRM